MANDLKVGYARVNITPPLGSNISGYYQVRIADGVLDELEACAVAISNGDKRAVLVSLDNLGMSRDFLDPWREEIAKTTVSISHRSTFIRPTLTRVQR